MSLIKSHFALCLSGAIYGSIKLGFDCTYGLHKNVKYMLTSGFICSFVGTISICHTFQNNKNIMLIRSDQSLFNIFTALFVSSGSLFPVFIFYSIKWLRNKYTKYKKCHR
jgi:hypothetical protein